MTWFQVGLLLSTHEDVVKSVFYAVRSVFENKNGSPYLFYQRQFWSCVKVSVK